MKFNSIRRSMCFYKSLIYSYKDLLEQYNFISETFAPAFYLNWSERFSTTPAAVQQSMDHIGIFSAETNLDKNKYTMFLDTIWRMLANKEVLKQGTAVLPYRRFTIPEQVEVWFNQIEHIANTQRFKLKMRVLTGHFASGNLTLEVSEGAIFHMFRHLGYSGTNKYPTPLGPEDILGIYGKLDLTVVDGNVRIQDIVDDSSIVNYNRKNIISYRVGNLLCPQEVGRICCACNECSDVCKASYHIRSFQYWCDDND